MSNLNFKQKIISRVEEFFIHLNHSDKNLDLGYLDECLIDLESDFQILTNYIQDERLNLQLEGMIITPQTEKRLTNAEKLFKSVQSEFKELRKLLENSDSDVLNKKLIIDKFDRYISPKIIWLFEEEKTIEYTALKHLYETGEIR